MEPWMAEEQRQRRLDRYWQRQCRCAACERPIRSEQCLALEEFGLAGYVCESCMEGALRYTADLEQ